MLHYYYNVVCIIDVAIDGLRHHYALAFIEIIIVIKDKCAEALMFVIILPSIILL